MSKIITTLQIYISKLLPKLTDKSDLSQSPIHAVYVVNCIQNILSLGSSFQYAAQNKT